jgi:hypothetical protein
VGPPAGTDYAYEVLSAEVVRQLSEAENVDRKLGVAAAALVAVAGAIYAARPPAIIAAVISGWLLVALVQAIRGFFFEQFGEGVNRRFLRERLELNLDPLVMKWHALVVLEVAHEVNRVKIQRKGRRLSQVMVTLGLVAAVGLLGKVFGLG